MKRTPGFWSNIYRKTFLTTDKQKQQQEDFTNLYLDQRASKPANVPILLLPLMDDYGTMMMGYRAAQLLGQSKVYQTKFFFLQSSIDNLYVQNNLKRQLLGFLENNFFYIGKLLRINKLKRKDLAFSNLFFSFRKGKKKITSKDELVKLELNGIVVGDLIYDTYLRFKSKPTVDINDPALYDLINYTSKLISNIQSYLHKNKTGGVVLLYSTYIHWGVLARIAISRNIPVHSTGSPFYFLQDLLPSYLYHTKNFKLYRKLFSYVSDPEFVLQKAKDTLEARLIGKIDGSIAYMRTSAYAEMSAMDIVRFAPSEKPFVVIFAHCFFDSPHIYGEMLFPDFYEWLDFVLNVATKNPGVTYFLKEHPNGMDGNDEIIAALIQKHKCNNIILLSSAVSNREILKYKPVAIFTVYGTICHEFAYQGIPVIVSGENPHSGFNFFYAPADKDELVSYILNVDKLGLPEKYDKQEILQFFAMHYMYYTPDFINVELTPVKDFNRGLIMSPVGMPADAITYKNI